MKPQIYNLVCRTHFCSNINLVCSILHSQDWTTDLTAENHMSLGFKPNMGLFNISIPLLIVQHLKELKY